VTNHLDPAAWREFVASRRTTRDFSSTEVPDELIDILLQDAMTAPSWSNTRPYLVAIAKGETRDRISQGFLARWEKADQALADGFWGKVRLLITRFGLPESDYKVFRHYPADLKKRSHQIGADLYGHIGIDRNDREKRSAQWARNYEFFGAPVSLFIFTHSALGEYSVSDAGLFMQNLMLSAHAHGLGSCAQGASALWAPVVKREFDVPKPYKLLCGIALGYRTDHKVNDFKAHRLDIAEIKLEAKND
jgi:nitroreductase